MGPHPPPSISLRPRQPPEREREREREKKLLKETQPRKATMRAQTVTQEGPQESVPDIPAAQDHQESIGRSPGEPQESTAELSKSLTEPRRRAQASQIKSKSDPRASPSTLSSHSFQTTSVVASQQQQPQCPQQPPERSLGSRDSSRDSHRGSCF